MKYKFPYADVYLLCQLSTSIQLLDHLGGFDQHYNNTIFTHLDKLPNSSGHKIIYHNILEKPIQEKYSNLNLQFSAELQDSLNFDKLKLYTQHPALNFKNFICSFNGSEHVSRKLLVASLKKFNFFNGNYSSKNIEFLADVLYGHVVEINPEHADFYSKFIVDYSAENFYRTVYSFGHDRFNHSQNIYKLANKLTESFLHIVSETMATSYCPFVTEKFLYSIVTRGLFLAYAQPGWHEHVEKYYGFKRYTKLFDYRFDAIQNPVERLVELMTMVSKFSQLSIADWKDLYQLEADTIEYNYDHYFSKNYLKHLKNYE